MSERRYRIQKAAELSGVSEELIRAWERRYAVLEPERTEGGFRLYSDVDVELLRRLRRLTREGTPIGEAVRMAPQLREEIVRHGQTLASGALDRSEIERWRSELIAAAEWRDPDRAERALNEALSALPAVNVYEGVIAPALREVGDHWRKGALDVAQEHLITQLLRGRLVSLLHGAPSSGGTDVVCACFPEEQHEVGAIAAALRLRHAGLRVTFLGQRTPADALGRLVRAMGARGVALSAVTDPGTGHFGERLIALKQALPNQVRVVVGGAAADAHRALCEDHGFRVFSDDWPDVIDWLAELPSTPRAG